MPQFGLLDVPAPNQNTLITMLQATFSADDNVRKPAEAFIKQNSKLKGYSKVLLDITASDFDKGIKRAGTVQLGILCDKHWEFETEA